MEITSVLFLIEEFYLNASVWIAVLFVLNFEILVCSYTEDSAAQTEVSSYSSLYEYTLFSLNEIATLLKKFYFFSHWVFATYMVSQ